MISKLSKFFVKLGPIVAVQFLGLPPLVAQAAPRPAVEAFAALPTFAELAISSDGDTIAFGATAPDGNLGVKIYKFSTRTASTFGVGKYKLRNIRFEDGGKILITISDAEYFDGVIGEDFKIVAIDLARNTVLNLGSLNLVSTLPMTPDVIASARYDDKPNGRFGISLNLYLNDLNTGRVQLLEYGRTGTYDWLSDSMGKAIARVDLDLPTKTTTLWLRDDRGSWREGVKVNNTLTAAISLFGFDSDGQVVFSNNIDDEVRTMQRINLATNEISTAAILGSTQSVDVEGVYVDDTNHQILGVSLGGLKPQTRWSNPDLIAAQSQLEARFPDKEVSIIEYTPNHKKVIASVHGLSEPDRYLILDVASDQITPIGSSMPALDNVAMGQIRSTTFKSRDGVDIPVYVTTPPGQPNPKNAPTIIFPHGGPASRDAPEFDWWAQFMASRGYVVIQPQFRGSTGFGRDFAQAGKRQWGNRMQDDVSDAVAWAVGEGTTDAARVCIVGASYGGYAALAGATMTPDLYKCAVSVAGVSDLPQMMREEIDDAGTARASSVNYWASHVGADDRAAMLAASPSRLAANVRAPILLIHGKEDSVVKFEQSQVMATALRRANKPFKLVELAAEDHWLSRAATRLQMLREIEAFLTVNLGPGLE
jgi:dipeptidyl aminopeptidase/acylaminoacyl peptidase